jgi:hypothetical protein
MAGVGGYSATIMPKQCEVPGCLAYPSFNYPNEKGGRRCAAHRLGGMADKRARRCTMPGCDRAASCGHPHNRSRTRCASHRLNGMVYLNHPMCTMPGCEKAASFSHPESKSRLRCSSHKLGGMVLRTQRVCAEPGCSKWPSFGFRGEPRLRCGAHKREGMVNVCGSKCTEPDCSKGPSFGYPGGRRTRCATHQLEGMLNLKYLASLEKKGLPDKPKGRAAVQGSKCAAPDCPKTPSFGFLGGKRTRCATHRLRGMLNLKYRASLAKRGLPSQPDRTDPAVPPPRAIAPHKAGPPPGRPRGRLGPRTPATPPCPRLFHERSARGGGWPRRSVFSALAWTSLHACHPERCVRPPLHQHELGVLHPPTPP